MTDEQIAHLHQRWWEAATVRPHTRSGAFPHGFFEGDQLIEQRYLCVYQLPAVLHELRKMRDANGRGVPPPPPPA